MQSMTRSRSMDLLRAAPEGEAVQGALCPRSHALLGLLELAHGLFDLVPGLFDVVVDAIEHRAWSGGGHSG